MADAKFKTTAGDDLIRSVTDGEFTSSDIIDGGAGTDTVKAALKAANQTLKPMLTSVETVEVALESVDTKDVTFDFTDATDVVTFKMTAADITSDDTEIVVKGVQTTDRVNLSTSYAAANTLTSATITFDKVTGTADAATVDLGGNITNVVVAGIENATFNTTVFAGTVTVADATTVTINSGSDAKKKTDVADVAQATAKLATLNLGGSGEELVVGSGSAIDFKGAGVVNITNTGKTTVTLANLVAASDTLAVNGGAGQDFVNIAAVAQGASIKVDTGAGADQVTIDAGYVTVNTGEGNDVLVADLSKVTAEDAIDLGAGEDTVRVSDATLNVSDKAALTLVKGAEALETTATGAVVIDASAVSIVDKFAVSGVMGAAFNGTADKAGATSVTLTSENSDVFTFSAARNGQGGGKDASTDSTLATGAAGGDAINVAVKLDNGTNVASLRFIGNADISGGAGEKGKSTAAGGAGGDALDAVNVERLNIAIIGTQATGTTADEVKFAGGAGGAKSGTGGADGANGQSVIVGVNATIVLSSELDATVATAAVHNNVDLGTVKGSNVTIEGSAFLGNIKAVAGDGNVTINGGAGNDTLTGGAGADVINGGAGTDVIDGGAGVDEMTGGAGKDTFKVAIGGTTGVTAVTDKVMDFAVGTDTIDLTAAVLVAAKASTDVSAAIGGAGAVAGDTLTASIADGVITLAGNAVAKIDTVAELIEVFKVMDVASTADTAAIQMGGSTYIVSDEAGNAVIEVIQLSGLTGVTKLGTTLETGVLTLA